MNIRPRIPIYQAGNIITAPLWYIDRYGGRTALLGWNKNKRYDNANLSLMLNDHLNAGDLNTVYTKNKFYTDNPAVVSSDILSFYDSDGNGMSAKDYEKFYNSQADIIRNHWALNLTYGLLSAGIHNPLYRRMFKSRSNPDLTKGSDYNIGYQEDQLKIEGSSTWLRRMDQYEKDDLNNPDRIHEIILKDGTKARYYKENNGNIRLLENNPSSDNVINGGNPLEGSGEVTITGKKNSSVLAQHRENGYGFDWNKLREESQKIFNNPNLWNTGRFVGSLIANNKIYNEALEGIKPVLRLTYNTHRQVVGDEATKQGFYRRAAQGLTKAARPFTSDADRQMAYQFEAKRIGDELRAQGDLADNQEIRRTSDESNQHQWANTLRATEVANANIASFNQANSLKHNLLALKHAAQWSSIDNFLKEIEYRKRKLIAEDLALDDLIFALLENQRLLDDPRLKLANLKLELAIKNNTNDKGETNWLSLEILDAQKELSNIKNTLTIESYKRKRDRKNYTISAKSGTKITRKKKDDLLYKSTKDVVEHFRKMSKMSSDAQNRKTPKIEKLTSHPKGTKKYLQGGLAPFVVYTPVSLGGETTQTTSTESVGSSKSSSSKKESSNTLDMIKELFKEVVGKGLPSDVNNLYISMLNFLSRARAFGNELSTDDIASIYLLQMLRLNLILYLKGEHDKALNAVIANDAVNEFAIDFAGRLVAKDDDDNIVYVKSLKEAEDKGVIPLTNSLLLLLRATLPTMAGRLELDSIAANGVGMSKIASFLKSLLPSLGSSESTIEGYTKKESNQIKAGLQLLNDAPDGTYEYSKYTKDLLAQVKIAINYLKGILPNNMKRIIETRAELGNLSVDLLIGSLVTSGTSLETRLLFTPVTGKAASKDSDSGSKGGLEMNNALKLLTGAGEGHLETFGIGNNNVFLAIGRQSTIADTSDSEKPFGADFSYNKIYESGIGRILDLDNASFGDVPINKTMKDSIIVDNSRIVSVDLPYTTTRDGRIIPDFKLLNRILEADEEILRQNLNPDKESDINKINQIYADKKLPIKYNSVNLLSGNYMKFAVILATAVEDVFLNKDGLETNATLTLVTDDNEKNKYVRLMSEITKDKKYSLNKPGIFSWGDKDIYKGSVFIPINGDIIDASLAGGASKVKTGMSDDYDTMRKAWQVRNYLKVPQVNFGN